MGLADVLVVAGDLEGVGVGVALAVAELLVLAVESQPTDADWPGEDEEFGYSNGHTHSHTFEVAGDYEYFCEPHQSNGMEGSFTVSE